MNDISEFVEVSLMFRTIRKKKNEISIDAAKELLRCSRRGILAVNGDVSVRQENHWGLN